MDDKKVNDGFTAIIGSEYKKIPENSGFFIRKVVFMTMNNKSIEYLCQEIKSDFNKFEKSVNVKIKDLFENSDI